MSQPSSPTPMEKEDQDYEIIPGTQRPDGTWRKSRKVKKSVLKQQESPKYVPRFKRDPANAVPASPNLEDHESKDKFRNKNKVKSPGTAYTPPHRRAQQKSTTSPCSTSTNQTILQSTKTNDDSIEDSFKCLSLNESNDKSPSCPKHD